MPVERPRRHWLRISVRTMHLMTLLVAVWLGLAVDPPLAVALEHPAAADTASSAAAANAIKRMQRIGDRVFNELSFVPVGQVMWVLALSCRTARLMAAIDAST